MPSFMQGHASWNTKPQLHHYQTIYLVFIFKHTLMLVKYVLFVLLYNIAICYRKCSMRSDYFEIMKGLWKSPFRNIRNYDEFKTAFCKPDFVFFPAFKRSASVTWDSIWDIAYLGVKLGITTLPLFLFFSTII